MVEQVTRETWIEAPADTVWDAVTGDGFLAPSVSLDLRPGGEATFSGAGEDRAGWVEEARPPSRGPEPGRARGRLVLWWACDGEPASRVEIDVEERQQAAQGPDGSGGRAWRTRVRVRELRPLDVLDLVGVPLQRTGGQTFGPALVAA